MHIDAHVSIPLHQIEFYQTILDARYAIKK